MEPIKHFERGDCWEDQGPKFNQIVDTLNALIKMSGDGLIQVNMTPNGVTVGLAMDQVNARVSRPYPVKFAKVIGVFDSAGSAWGTYHTSDFQVNCTAERCNADGQITGGKVLRLKLSGHLGMTYIGFTDVVYGDIVGWVPNTGRGEEVAGAADTYYDGYVLPHMGLADRPLNLGYPCEVAGQTWKITEVFHYA